MLETQIQKQFKDEEAEEESVESKGRSVKRKRKLQHTEKGKTGPVEKPGKNSAVVHVHVHVVH